MALEKRLVSIPLGVGGVDTRSDAKAIMPPRLHTLTNGVFTTPSSARKRYGYTAISTQEWYNGGAQAVAGARLIGTLNDELLAGDGEALMSYSNGYLAHRGYLTPFQVSSTSIRPAIQAYNSDCASTGAITVYAWEEYHTSGTVMGIQYLAVDDNTGGTIGAGWLAYHTSTSYSRPMVIAVGSSIHVYYVDQAGTTIKVMVITRSGATVTGSLVTVASDIHGSLTFYDVRKAGTQALVVYNSSTATTIKHGYVSEAGSVGAFTTRTTAAAVSALGCAVDDSTLAYAIMWAMNSSTTVTAGLFNSNASQLVAPTTLGTSYPSTTFINITGAIVSGATSKLHVLVDYEVNSGIVYHATLTSAGAATNGLRWFRQSMLASHAWVHGGYVYCTIIGGTWNGQTARNNLFVARCGTIVDDGPGSPYPNTSASPTQPRRWDRYIAAGGFLPLASRGNKDDWVMLGHVSTLTGPKYRAVFGHYIDIDGERGLRSVDLDTTETSPLVQAGACAYMPSAQGLSQYDGRYVTECGFWMYPPTPSSSLIAGTNLDANASYGYRVYYEWTNNRGERERSSAVEITVTTTSSRQVRLTLYPLVHTNKTRDLGINDAQIVVYRTLGGETDAYYRVTNVDPDIVGVANAYIRNDPTVETITWDDNMTDTAASAKEQDYLSAGELDEVAPIASRVIATGNGRVFLAGFDDPNLIRYSKTRTTGQALAFNEALEIVLDAGVGPITGMAMLQDSLVAFRETATFVIGGDGFDNAGTGTTLTPPRLISEEIGCVNQRSIVTTPMGIFFQSKRGFYVVGPDGMKYLGEMVESYNSQTVLAAVVMPGTHEVRLTMSGGGTLLYDLLAGQWSTWTIGGIDACVWQNQYVRLVDATAAIHKEVADQYHDNSSTYTMVMRLPWIRLGSLSGFQRIYKVRVLGDYRSGHKIRVKVRYNYSETVVSTFTWDATTIGSTDYQFEIRLARQQCEAISLEFEDIVDDVPNALRESYRLNELLLVIGVKPGTWLDAANKKAL